MGAVGTGSGKLILFGEHSAVFGHPAIGVQLPERTTVSFHEAKAGTWDLGEIPQEDRLVVQRLLERLEALLPELARRGGRTTRIESTVPRGVGLGSSAALCTAVAAAALTLLGGRTGAPALARKWELAHELERIFHGTPSGVDTGLSLLEGLTAFSPRPPALPLWERVATAPFWLVIGALPRAGGSAALIRGIGERMRAGERKVRRELSALGDIARQAKDELAAGGQAAALGGLADEAMKILRQLGLSDPALDLLLDEGKCSGALGGKLSGAGGGGAFFLVVADGEAARATAARLGSAARSRGISLVMSPRSLCVDA